MQSDSIDPHRPNRSYQIPAYLAFINHDVPCFAAIMMEIKTPTCETSDYSIDFPIHGMVNIDLDNNEQVEMWQGLTTKNYMKWHHHTARKTTMASTISLKELLAKQLGFLQTHYPLAMQLLTLSLNVKHIEELRKGTNQ